MMYPCRFPGCPSSYVSEGLRAAHELKPHVRCSCGRVFSRKGYPCHRGSVRRHGISHPPFPGRPEPMKLDGNGNVPLPERDHEGKTVEDLLREAIVRGRRGRIRDIVKEYAPEIRDAVFRGDLAGRRVTA